MSCTAPETYYKRDPAKFGGVAGLTKDPRFALVEGMTLTVKCGKCMDCRLSFAHEWSLRVMHEVKTSGPSSFVTLTYDDAHLPVDQSLNYRHFQLFMHRLRKRLPGGGRFLMCGEYGDDFGRPHYHAILFNVEFGDRQYLSSKDGVKLYTSKLLADLWQLGFVTVGDVTLDSASYVARYSTKKITGPAAGAVYQFVTLEGEVVDREPPFLHSSNRPGIGYDWFARYHSDVFPCDYLVHGGKKFPVPRYYSKLMERLDAGAYEGITRVRKRAMVARRDDVESSPRRLMVKQEYRRLISKAKREMR